MSNGVKIEMVSGSDTNLYSRSATSKLISSDDAPSSPPLTIKALQIASGRRKGFEAKNDSDGEKRSERRVASRVPRFEDGELKLPTERFDAIAIDAGEQPVNGAKSNSRTNGTKLNPTEPKLIDPVETPLSPKLREDYGSNIIQLNVSPLPQRKDLVPIPPPVDSTPSVPSPGPVITNLSPPDRKSPSPKSSGRRTETPKRPDPVEKREGSPPAGRRSSLNRSPPTSIETRSISKEVAKPRSRNSESKTKNGLTKEKSSGRDNKTALGNIHYDHKSVISQPDLNRPEVHGPDRYSNRRKASSSRTAETPNSDSHHRPKKERSMSPPRMPRDSKPSIRIEGRTATARDMFESSGSLSGGSVSSSSRQSDSSTTETTSRRKIKSRSEALDKKLTDAFPGGEFSPEDDDHLKFAIHTALEESRAKSVQEAIDAGHELNAEVLKSLTRPNAIEEVIETMVSQRREHIREKRISDRRHPPSSSKSEVTVKKTKTSVGSKIEKGRSPKVVENEDDLDEAEEDTTKLRRKAKSKSSPGKKSTPTKKLVIQTKIEDDVDEDQAEDSDGPLIETVDDSVQDSRPTPPQKTAKNDAKAATPPATPPDVKPKPDTKPKSRIMVDDGTPKNELPGIPLLIPSLLKQEKTEEVEVIGGKSPSKPNRPGSAATKKSDGVSVATFHVDEDGEVSGEIQDGDQEATPIKAKRVGSKRVEAEANVKLPQENRKIRKGDYLEKADELGSRDYVYDPLGVDEPFGDEDDSVGDDIYDESSEDDTKLTIAEKKDEMLYRFKLIKEGYPGIALPRITKKMKLAKMVRLYEHVMSRIKLKVKTNNFKIFLVLGFLAMQFAVKKFGGDAAGFTINQMTSMKQYEKYLREIGESDFSSFGGDLPVMVRLPFFMAVNMGIFLVAKWIFKKTGKDYTTQFHKLYAQLTGGDDYVYIKDDGGTAGLGAGGDAEGGGGGEGGGIFGMIKSFLSMMGGNSEGGGGEDKPKRGEAAGPTYKRRPRKTE